jgi:hypothetical protein
MRWTMITMTLMLMSCGRAEAPSSETATPAAGETPFPREVASDALPLTRGFYVSDDTACGEASNATLGLLRRTGWNGSQYACDFTRIEQLDDARYRVTEQCQDIRAGDQWTSTREWTLTGAQSLIFHQEDGSKSGFRHCPQTELPEGWREAEIDDLIAE